MTKQKKSNHEAQLLPNTWVMGGEERVGGRRGVREGAQGKSLRINRTGCVVLVKVVDISLTL